MAVLDRKKPAPVGGYSDAVPEFLLGEEFSPEMENMVAVDGRVSLRAGFQQLAFAVVERDSECQATFNGTPVTFNGVPVCFTPERGLYLDTTTTTVLLVVEGTENVFTDGRQKTINGQTYYVRRPPSQVEKGRLSLDDDVQARIYNDLPHARFELDVLGEGVIGAVSSLPVESLFQNYWDGRSGNVFATYDRDDSDPLQSRYDRQSSQIATLDTDLRVSDKLDSDDLILYGSSFEDTAGILREVYVSVKGIWLRRPMVWTSASGPVIGMDMVRLYEFDPRLPPDSAVLMRQAIDESYKDLFVSVENRGLFRVKLDTFPGQSSDFERTDPFVSPLWSYADFELLLDALGQGEYAYTEPNGDAATFEDDPKVGARTLLAHAGRLIAANVTIDGRRHPYQVIWSPAGKLNELESADLLDTSAAGFVNLLEDTDGGEITDIVPLGESSFAVFKERATYLMTPTAVGFTPTLRSNDHGAVSTHAACSLGHSVFFISHDDAMIFDGLNVRPFGLGNKSNFRRWLKELLESSGKPYCSYIPERGEVWVLWQGEKRALSLTLRDASAAIHTLKVPVRWSNRMNIGELVRDASSGSIELKRYPQGLVWGGNDGNENIWRAIDEPFDDGEAFPAHCRTVRTDFNYDSTDGNVPGFLRSKQITNYFVDLKGTALFNMGTSEGSAGDIMWQEDDTKIDGFTTFDAGAGAGRHLVARLRRYRGAQLEWYGFGVTLTFKEHLRG